MSGFYSKTETREKSAVKDHFRGKKRLDSFSESELLSQHVQRNSWLPLAKEITLQLKFLLKQKDILKMIGNFQT